LNPPATPTSLETLQIPSSYTTTTSNQPFLLADTQEAERILIFTTKENIQELSEARILHADGTFKCAPLLFTQLYTIHGVVQNKMLPLVFTLLPNKNEVPPKTQRNSIGISDTFGAQNLNDSF